MKINKSNYIKVYENLDAKLISESVEKVHQYIVKTTENGKTWSVMTNSPTVRKVIETQFRDVEKIQKQIGTKSKGVENIGDAQRLIKRYVSLQGKIKKVKDLLPLLKALQQAIVKKIIRKTSPLSKLIEGMQGQLLALCNKFKPSQEIRIDIKNLNEYIAAAGGETIFKSIFLIRRFIELVTATKGAAVSDYRKLLTAFEKTSIGPDDPYQAKVKEVEKILRSKAENKSVPIPSQELKGLQGIANLGVLFKKSNRYTRPCKGKLIHSDADQGACSWHKGLHGTETAEPPTSKAVPVWQIAKKEYKTFPFTGLWKQLFGQPCRFKLMVHGGPGSGKSNLMLRFAHYLATQFGPTLYVSTEEYDTPTMTIKINSLPNMPGDLKMIASMDDEDLNQYRFVFLDSVNHTKFSVEDFKKLSTDFPNTSFILIFQHTKAGQYRGSNEWEHEMDIAALVDQYNIKVHKNRYGTYGEANFFDPTLRN